MRAVLFDPGYWLAGRSGRSRMMTHLLQVGQDASCSVPPCRLIVGLTSISQPQRGHNNRALGWANDLRMLRASSVEYIAGVSR
jgi:hypothetical protein